MLDDIHLSISAFLYQVLKKWLPETSVPHMAPRSNTNALAFALDFRDSIWVAGEIISGRVDLNVACAQDDGIETLCVNLKGFIVTYVASILFFSFRFCLIHPLK